MVAEKMGSTALSHWHMSGMTCVCESKALTQTFPNPIEFPSTLKGKQELIKKRGML